MRLKALFPLLMLVMVSGCRAGEALTPEDTGEMPWGEIDFAFFTPLALPAVVTKALIIDNEKVVYTFRTLDSTQENPDSVGSWSSRISRHAQFNKIRHPPAQMLFCRDSVIDKKTYETRITFSSTLWEKMSVPTGKDGVGIRPGMTRCCSVRRLKAKSVYGFRTARQWTIYQSNR